MFPQERGAPEHNCSPGSRKEPPHLGRPPTPTPHCISQMKRQCLQEQLLEGAASSGSGRGGTAPSSPKAWYVFVCPWEGGEGQVERTAWTGRRGLFSERPTWGWPPPGREAAGGGARRLLEPTRPQGAQRPPRGPPGGGGPGSSRRGGRVGRWAAAVTRVQAGLPRAPGVYGLWCA